jgi:hypothetical protein
MAIEEERMMSPTATPLLEMYEGQARAAAEVVASWRQAPPDTAKFAQGVNDLIAELADEWPRRMERMYQREWRRAAQGPLPLCVPLGESVFGIWDSYTALLRSIRALARSLAADGPDLPHLADLEAAIDRLERNRVKAHDNWPWFRPEDEEAALAEHARGESLTLEEVFSALPHPTH